MPVSYREVNYSLRPAKAVERKMMSEAFRRLYPFHRVSDYRYIGFGSIYFADFQIIHRALGLTDMLSVEKNSYAADCFRFNQPYKAITLKFGHSNDVLPRLTWDKHTILWLDYDGKLDMDALADIDTFCVRARSGSMIAVSVNAETEKEPSAEIRQAIDQETGEPFNLDAYRLKKLQSLIGVKVPVGTTGSGLRGKDAVAAVFRKTMLNEISEVLSERNALLEVPQKLTFHQVFNFEYKDGANMLTVGGVLVANQDQPLFEACAFEKLEFVRTAEEPYAIRVPCLTGKEVRHLNAQLPCADITTIDAPGIPETDVRTYADIYRYFPAFSEILFA